MVESSGGGNGSGSNPDALANSIRLAMKPLFEGLEKKFDGLEKKLDTVVDRLDHIRDFSSERWRDHEVRIQALERRTKGGDDPKGGR